MIIFALLGKGLGNDEDSWDIVSLHKTQEGAEAAQKVHAEALWDEDDGHTLEQYVDEFYEINQHELME